MSEPKPDHLMALVVQAAQHIGEHSSGVFVLALEENGDEIGVLTRTSGSHLALRAALRDWLRAEDARALAVLTEPEETEGN